MKTPKKKTKKRQYKSAETRARQLAGLANVKVENHVMGVEVQKIAGKGLFASVSEEQRKQILELYCKGYGCRYIADKVGISHNTVSDIKSYFLDYDSQFRNAFFTANLKNRMQGLIDSTMDRAEQTLPEMNGRDTMIGLGILLDKYVAIEKAKTPDQLHQHIHLHAHAEINDELSLAMKKI
jgi:hypothetical protein